MCFSPKISFSFFIIGSVLAVYSYLTPILREYYMHILFAFYALMELLQTVQYKYVNQCSNPVNKLLTEIAYVLVIVQPLMWNIVFYLRTKSKTGKTIFMLTIILFLVWMAANISLRLGYNGDNRLNKCGIFNNDTTCTKRDSSTSHLYWQWTTAHYRDMTANYFMYFVLWFVPALLVNETMITSIGLIIGALAGLLLTIKYGVTIVEFPSTWCFISVPLFLLAIVHMVLRKLSKL